MSSPESEFPTIADLHAVLTRLIERGFGALPVQTLVAPDSTVQALARDAGARADDRPAIMIEFELDDATGRIPPSIITADRLSSSEPRSAVQ
jgi:hypothetical protein